MDGTVVAAASLNQWALDFKGNQERIIETIIRARREHKAKIRLGQELEVSGYSCEDHHLEPDTVHHSWESLCNIIRVTQTSPYDDILCIVSMPVQSRGVLYNCSVCIYAGKIWLIKPKTVLPDDGAYREPRWFKAWQRDTLIVDFALPPNVRRVTGQTIVPFGVGLLRSEEGYIIGIENCEELWSPNAVSIRMFLQGAHIVLNPSGSYFSIGKLRRRVDLIKSATMKTGGIYVYTNMQGCEGGKLYFDGCPIIGANGEIINIGRQFSLNDIDIVTANLNLTEIDAYRFSVASTCAQAEASLSTAFKVFDIPNFKLVTGEPMTFSSPLYEMPFFPPEIEIGKGVACWLWDYLRRSKASGFFLPLSGGADSAATLAIVSSMCHLVVAKLKDTRVDYNSRVLLEDVKRIVGLVPDTPRQMLRKLMYAGYMSTENSSEETKARAKAYAQEVGCTFFDFSIETVCNSFIEAFCDTAECERPKFKVHGGTPVEDLALQNVQSRSRMVMSYLAGQLIPWFAGKKGWLLILGSSNLDESLTGYFTKYDCSSADINPIGSLFKKDLKKFLMWAADTFNYPTLVQIANAAPTAELTPLGESGEIVQTDEDDLGLKYDEIRDMGVSRKVSHCGPLFMFKQLSSEWGLPLAEVADKVKRFFLLYSRNRHKIGVATPSVHLGAYNCEDSRYDLRQTLYNIEWEHQFAAIDLIVAQEQSTTSSK
jgi:NAD+ synthase (glutamine-hydrolysing)